MREISSKEMAEEILAILPGHANSKYRLI